MSLRELTTWAFGLGLMGNALLFVPQIAAVWRKKTDEGVSLVTFGGFCLLQIVSVIHGLYEHDLAMVLGMGSSLVTCGCVTVLTIFFRVKRMRSAAAK
jgi:MtN3 and saliva related transmembrane protein